MKENGLKVSTDTLNRFKKENNLVRKYNKKLESEIEVYNNDNKRRKEIGNKLLSKKVYQYSIDGELIKEWNSTSEVGKNGYSQVAVCNCCNGKVKSHKGYKWSYEKLESEIDTYNNIELERPIEEKDKTIMNKAKENINTLYTRFSILDNANEINNKYNMFMTYLFKQCFSKEISLEEYKEYCDMVTAKKLELLSNCHSMSVA